MTGIVTGPPHENVTSPPPASAAPSAVSVQEEAVPLPTTVVIWPVTMAAAADLACDGGMAVVVQMFFFGVGAVFAAVAFEHAPLGKGLAEHLGVEQRKNARIEAEMGAEHEGDLRVLLLQTGHLLLDTFDQHAGEQINRDDGNLHRTQPDLPLDDRFQARPGDAGKGQVDQFMVVGLENPARHLG